MSCPPPPPQGRWSGGLPGERGDQPGQDAPLLLACGHKLGAGGGEECGVLGGQVGAAGALRAQPAHLLVALRVVSGGHGESPGGREVRRRGGHRGRGQAGAQGQPAGVAAE